VEGMVSDSMHALIFGTSTAAGWRPSKRNCRQQLTTIHRKVFDHGTSPAKTKAAEFFIAIVSELQIIKRSHLL